MTANLIIGIAIVIVVFYIWRRMSAASSTRRRDEALVQRLNPLVDRFESEADVSAQEIQELAAAPELRRLLYSILTHYRRQDLFPSGFTNEQSQAESALVEWMLLPSAFGASPAALQLEKRVVRNFADTLAGKQYTFYVFRFQPPAGRKAPDWQLGVAGPFIPGTEPYSGKGAFCRGDEAGGKVTPDQLVDRYVDVLRKRGGI